MRLDLYLTQNHNIQSRNKASELIKNKKVTVDGKIISKPSFVVSAAHHIEVNIEGFYVSRAAYKLKYFLDDNNINIENLHALDIGSSTGGFTQILLLKNVSSVTCVDVGSNQLHESIRKDKRIIVQENTDIRDFFKESTEYKTSDETFPLVTCDVSFISVLNIIEDINRLSSNKIIILYKPQFEVGREIKRDSNGVVQDEKAILQVRELFLEKAVRLKWNLQISQKSKLSGKNGNVEELFFFTK